MFLVVLPTLLQPLGYVALDPALITSYDPPQKMQVILKQNFLCTHIQVFEEISKSTTQAIALLFVMCKILFGVSYMCTVLHITSTLHLN